VAADSVEQGVTDEDLDAFADGMLPAARAAFVAGHIAHHPAAARRVEDIRRLNRLMRGQVDAPDEAIPPEMRNLARDLADALAARRREAD
jgi:anti-sigma factor RsiW